MTSDEIKLLIEEGSFPINCPKPQLIETHISWVILCDEFVFKIKKPIHYSFLDFSTLESRLFYCRQEIKLNWRLTFNIYLDILEVRKIGSNIEIGGKDGKVIDYVVRMRRLDDERQMNILLTNNLVQDEDILNLAQNISSFHRKASVITNRNVLDIKAKFNDLASEQANLGHHLGKWAEDLVIKAILQSDTFLDQHQDILKSRLKNGYCRDVHGDLHSRNIFLLPQPIIFDCIEFNEDYRQIDLLNEIAFLCMDLDSFGKASLAELFLKHYCELLPMSMDESEQNLFIYYKAYRANVRAKVNSLRAGSAENEKDRKTVLAEAEKYLRLMEQYLGELNEKR